MNELIAVQNIAQWQKLKTTRARQRLLADYENASTNMALDEFYGWFQQAGRSGDPEPGAG